MKRVVATLLVFTLVLPAFAEPRKVVVLQAEGRADGKTKAKVDAAILKLAAQGGDLKVSPGDITISDAAAAVGCKPDAQACKDEIIGMLAVDEIVFASVTPKPGGVEVRVSRTGKGGPVRDNKVMVTGGVTAERLEPLATLFKTEAAPPAPADSTPPTRTPVPEPPAPTPSVPPIAAVAPHPPLPAEGETGPAVSPLQSDTPAPGRRRLQIAGIVTGSAFVLFGFMCWGKASDIQTEIDQSPTNTKAQLDALADLEASGDSYAGWGNALFIGGAVLAGVSTYFLIKNRKRPPTSSARVSPAVFDHGAGIALTIGGTP